MFSDWKAEKAIAGLVTEAQDVADWLAGAKPHHVEARAAAVRLVAAQYLADGQDLFDLPQWSTATRRTFVSRAQARIAVLRKAREYDAGDGLAVWLHTARAVDRPRIAAPVAQIWQMLVGAGQNADSMAQEMIEEAGLPFDPYRRVPEGVDIAPKDD